MTLYKTRPEHWDQVRTTIESMHKYEVPCIIPVSYTHLDVYKRQRKDCDRDNYMSAQDALEYGLIDKIV